MTTETDMKIPYVVVLRQLQDELNGIEGRRQALQASIAAMKALVEEDEQPQLPSLAVTAVVPANGGKPAIPPRSFRGKTVTQGYRDLMRVWPGEYTPPQIADALVAGGISATTRTALIQAVHSVLKREREKKEREAAEAAG